MYLKKSKNKKTGRTYLSIADGHWDKTKSYTKTTTIKGLGFLDKLQKEYEDPIAYFEMEIKKMTDEKRNSDAPVTLNLDIKRKMKRNSDDEKNFGYAAISKVYHELELDKFYINRQRHLNVEYNINNIMKLLVFSRLLNPSSKKKTFENKGMYFENTDFSLDDLYRSLSIINKHKEALQLWIHKHIKEQYNRNTDLVYYDVTNYYFEIDEPDDLRKNGVCKEHRPNPIVQMGLFMDSIGMPISYKLFSGNTVDKVTLIPMLQQVKKEYDLGRVIVVADKGLNTGDNIYYTLSRKDGYVISQTVRGANEELKNYVLNEDGYTWYGKEYKKKSRLCPREISVTSVSGKKIKRTVHEKQVIFYSEDYAKRAKAERAPALMKAMDLISNPGKYKKAMSYGAAKYVKNLEFDKKTGEILTTKSFPLLDEEKLRKEEEMDGYYAIVTSEWEKTDDQIIEIYRGLWRIEESFKITKSELEARPVYMSREDHIEAHFLTCFISLAIARVLQHRTKNKYSVGRILESLKKASCAPVEENYYTFKFYDEVLEDIGTAFGIDFSNKYMRLGEIKNILGNSKKS